jgi:hypothetical protein
MMSADCQRISSQHDCEVPAGRRQGWLRWMQDTLRRGSGSWAPLAPTRERHLSIRVPSFLCFFALGDQVRDERGCLGSMNGVFAGGDKEGPRLSMASLSKDELANFRRCIGLHSWHDV